MRDLFSDLREVVTLAMSLGACASLHTRAAPAFHAPTDAPIVRVAKQHAQDMKVYLWAEPGTSLWRLGVVPSKSSATFPAPVRSSPPSGWYPYRAT